MLATQYHRLMEKRKEGLHKYGARLYYQIYGPKARISFPVVSRKRPGFQSIRIAGFYIGDRPPVVPFVERIFDRSPTGLNVLEIGPGRGDLCDYLLTRYGKKISTYFGIDSDEAIVGPYRRITSIEEMPGEIDVAIASEVAEHMPADVFVDQYLRSISAQMTTTGRFVVTVPNPIVAGGIARDFSHVQSWPWYDMYAVLRLFFDVVDVSRTHYVADPKRLAFLPLRFLMAHSQETDWCEGLVFIASSPSRNRAER
ncbi:MAG: hypothetical protein NVS2B3_05300 [Vulcanimicrobiaceae bacterium]